MWNGNGSALIGPAWGVPNVWLNEGHSFGITAAGGAGWQLAEWIVEGEPGIDLLAVDPRRYFAMYPEFDIEPAQLEAFAATRTGAVAGRRLVERYGWRIGQKLPLASEIHAKANGDMNWEFDLVGIIDAEDPAVRGNTDVVLINVAHFDEARAVGRGKTGWYIERIADSTQAGNASGSVTSTASPRIRGPRPERSATVWSTASLPRAQIATSTPSAINSSVMARPMPLLPPVTIAARPARLISMCTSPTSTPDAGCNSFS